MSRRRSSAANRLAFERLESRDLMAWVPVDLPPEIDDRPVNVTPELVAAAHEQVQADLADVPEAMQGKVSQSFWNGLKEIEALVLDRQVFHHEGLPLSQVELQRAHLAQLNDAGEVYIQFDLNAWNEESIAKLQELGLRFDGAIPEYQRVYGWVNGIRVQILGSLPEVERLDFPILGITHSTITSLPEHAATASEVTAQVGLQISNLLVEPVNELRHGESFYLNVFINVPANASVDFDESLPTLDNDSDVNQVDSLLVIPPPSQSEQLRFITTDAGEVGFTTRSATETKREASLFGEESDLAQGLIEFGRQLLRIPS